MGSSPYPAATQPVGAGSTQDDAGPADSLKRSLSGSLTKTAPDLAPDREERIQKGYLAQEERETGEAATRIQSIYRGNKTRKQGWKAAQVVLKGLDVVNAIEESVKSSRRKLVRL